MPRGIGYPPGYVQGFSSLHCFLPWPSLPSNSNSNCGSWSAPCLELRPVDSIHNEPSHRKSQPHSYALPNSGSHKQVSARRGRRTLRRARRLVFEAPRPALRVPGARSAKGASTTGRSATLNARSNPSNPLGSPQREQLTRKSSQWELARKRGSEGRFTAVVQLVVGAV